MKPLHTNKIPIPVFHRDYYSKSDDDACKLVPSVNDATAHTHVDFYEFSLITNGSFKNEYPKHTSILPKGTLFFFSCGETHSILTNEPDSLHLSFIIKKDYFEEFCRIGYSKCPDFISTKFTECHLSRESAIYLSSILDRIMMATTNYSELCNLFMHNALFHLFFNNQTDMAPKDLNRIEQHIDILRAKFDSFQYLDEPIEKIYSQFPFNRTTLINHFKQQTGQTIVQYRNCKRMEYSARLLILQNLSIAEIANQIGISSLSYFSKKFYEYYGVLPRDYTSLQFYDDTTPPEN